ncbi:MAG: glucosaminidase domain-containing protein [Desulfuromonadales bacterium]|nr:glucosaminidase domain-containing protein [Desulfuromonadales bacterium]
MINHTTISRLRTSLFLLLLPLFIACHLLTDEAAAQQIDHDRAQTIRPETTSGLQAFYQTLDYDWMQLEKGVPPLILENIPTDITYSVNTASKKRTFFMGLLPMVLLANQEIEQEREEILLIFERHSTGTLSFDDRQRLEAIANRYGLRGHMLNDHRMRSRLLRRVDTLPPALVLAQAANESAWGTSKFAQRGNNFFGEWTFRPGTGIVPEDRPPGEIYEVRKFSSIYESIRSYMNNLNSNGAYRKLRDIRERLRQAEQPVTGIALTTGLLKYSQRGEDYIVEIQAMIRQNRLSLANSAFLRQPETDAAIRTRTSGSGLFSSRNRMIGGFSSMVQNP